MFSHVHSRAGVFVVRDDCDGVPELSWGFGVDYFNFDARWGCWRVVGVDGGYGKVCFAICNVVWCSLLKRAVLLHWIVGAT